MTLSASDVPAGTSSRVRLGMRASDSRIWSSRAAAAVSSSSSSSLSARVSSISGRGILPGLLQRAHLLAQLVAARLQLFGLRDGLAPALVESAKIAQQRSRVGPARAQLLFHFFQVPPDKSQVEHGSFQFTRPSGGGRVLVVGQFGFAQTRFSIVNVE